MLLLPDFILVEIFTFLHPVDLLRFRLVSKGWGQFLSSSSILGCKFYYRKECIEGSSIMARVGNYIDHPVLGANYPRRSFLTEDEIDFIQKCCPNLKSLTFNLINEEKLDLDGILKLGLSLPKLKYLLLQGEIRKEEMEVVDPLIARIDRLEIGSYSRIEFKAEFIRSLSRHKLKWLRFPFSLGLDFLDLAAQQLATVAFFETFNNDTPSYAYDRAKGMFQKLRLICSLNGSRFLLSFDLDTTAPGRNCGVGKLPSEQFKYLQSFFDLNAAPYSELDSHFPPIKCLEYSPHHSDSSAVESSSRDDHSPAAVVHPQQKAVSRQLSHASVRRCRIPCQIRQPLPLPLDCELLPRAKGTAPGPPSGSDRHAEPG